METPSGKELTTLPVASLGAEAVTSGLSVDMVMYNPVIVKREAPYGTEEGGFLWLVYVRLPGIGFLKLYHVCTMAFCTQFQIAFADFKICFRIPTDQVAF